MTETQWADCSHPATMLQHLSTAHSANRTKVGRRKLRLFCCACVRQVWDLLLQEESRAAVEVAERFADGQATKDDLQAAFQRGYKARDETKRATGRWLGGDDAGSAVGYATYAVLTENEIKRCIMHACLARFYEHRQDDRGTVDQSSPEYSGTARALANWLRELFGNPFRPIKVPRSWLTPDVLTLARVIYAERAFDQMPILGDALQDAGCTNETVLSHCRDAQRPHAPGCWVIDLLLGKS